MRSHQKCDISVVGSRAVQRADYGNRICVRSADGDKTQSIRSFASLAHPATSVRLNQPSADLPLLSHVLLFLSLSRCSHPNFSAHSRSSILRSLSNNDPISTLAFRPLCFQETSKRKKMRRTWPRPSQGRSRRRRRIQSNLHLMPFLPILPFPFLPT